MKSLVLAFTQAERGAPGFLSRRGEDSAKNMAESIGVFLQDTLGVRWQEGLALRQAALHNDLRLKLLRSEQDLPAALSASLSLFPSVLVCSGSQEASLNTAGWVGELLSLPICVLQDFDKFSVQRGSVNFAHTQTAAASAAASAAAGSGGFSDSQAAIPTVFEICRDTTFACEFERSLEAVFKAVTASSLPCPKVLLVSTNIESLGGWLKSQEGSARWQETCTQLWEASQEGLSPAVFSFGCEYSAKEALLSENKNVSPFTFLFD